ncbi:MAG: 3-hydroxyacyl-CoA dehydrogenase family protein [Chloroflexi bacterium]|nr:3-hydroxyacyl-CoA dehydrogenase family protein [Chloroflexota bacterium]
MQNNVMPQRAAIIGAGTMGLGIAECFALAGKDVVLIDASPELSELALKRLAHRVRAHVDAGLLEPSALDRTAAVKTAKDLATAVADADLVLEAVPENIDIKREVLSACDRGAPLEAIIATNTSSLPMDELAAFVNRDERFLGMHWFNPPEWTPAVEIIPSSRTDVGVVKRLREFLLAIGKRPAAVGSAPGFVANRIQFALFREAIACVAEGLATPAELDELVRGSFGFRLPFYGPFQIADMAGLDVYSNIFGVLERGLGEQWQPPELLRTVVDAGRHGVKSFAGFYEYSEEERDKMLLERDRRYAALNQLLAELPPQTFAPRGTADDQD